MLLAEANEGSDLSSHLVDHLIDAVEDEVVANVIREGHGYSGVKYWLG